MTQQNIPNTLPKATSDQYDAPIARAEKRKVIINAPRNPVLVPLPKDPKEQNQLIDECYAYLINNPDLKDIDEFPISKRMSPYRFKRIKNPYFEEVFSLCMYIIGNRIQKDWYEFKSEKGLSRDLLWTYKKDYQEAQQAKTQQAANALVSAGITPEDLEKDFASVETPPDVRKRRVSAANEQADSQIRATQVSGELVSSSGE